MIAQQTLNGLVLGGVYALFALGFTLIFGIHRIMNMAHGAVFMAGAFVGLYTVRFGLPIWLALPVAMVGCRPGVDLCRGDRVQASCASSRSPTRSWPP
jgi:branched-subunit amino acid ABC-type transport system permease component